jgi:hypothetical protein
MVEDAQRARIQQEMLPSARGSPSQRAASTRRTSENARPLRAGRKSRASGARCPSTQCRGDCVPLIQTRLGLAVHDREHAPRNPAAFMKLSGQQGVRQSRSYPDPFVAAQFAERPTVGVGAASRLTVRIPT